MTLTASQTYIVFEYTTGRIDQTNLSKAALDVNLQANADFSILPIMGGTASLSDTQTGNCSGGSGNFSGVIPANPSPVHTLVTGDGHSTGDGNLDLTIYDAFGIDPTYEAGGQALFATIVMSVSYGDTCGSSVATCTGDGDLISGLVMRRTDADTFAGTCHEEIGGETTKGSFD